MKPNNVQHCADWFGEAIGALTNRMRATARESPGLHAVRSRPAASARSEALLAALRSGRINHVVPTLRGTAGFGSLVELVDTVEQGWRDGQIGPAEALKVLITAEMIVTGAGELRVRSGPVGRGLIGVAEHDQHTLGALVAAKTMELNGWLVDYEPSRSYEQLFRELAARHYDFVGLSVGHDAALAGLADAIAEARRASKNGDIRVLIGGGAIGASPGDYRFLGADGVCTSPVDALNYLADGRRARRYGEH